MRGQYNFYEDNNLVASSPNIVTWEGKKTVLRYLAGLNQGYAGTIGVGISNALPLITDTSLGYEIGRAPVNMRSVKSYGTQTGSTLKDCQIVFRGTLPENFVGRIFEVGLFSSFSNQYMAQRSPTLITAFESNTWTTSSFTGVLITTDQATSTTSGMPVRIGGRGIQFYDSASGANEPHAFVIRNDLVNGDFGRYSNADIFALSAIVQSPQSANLTFQVRFYTDSGNYYTGTFTTGPLQAGSDTYVIMRTAKSTFAVTGIPNWASIAYCEVIFPSQSVATAGTFTVLLDGMSVFPAAILTPDFTTVSRATLAAPLSKDLGKTLDVEYVLEFDL